MGTRTLADRLAAVRTERPQRSPPREPADDRVGRLASWFGARLAVADGGAAVLVERSIPLAADAVRALGGLAPATYFDTETTGLSTGAGTVVFMAGMGHVAGDRLVVRQLLLPDYPHEPGLLRQVTAELAHRNRLVTYNGRGFDLPLLSARLTVNGLFKELASLPAGHDDLLPVARRLFRRPLGGARLVNVEAGILGVRRASDCPSSEVPARYFGYLRGGSPDLLAEVLDHNLQDIVSLALLEAEVLRLLEGGWRDAEVLDRHGMAVELLRAGAPDEALEVVETAPSFALDPAEAMGLRRLATRLLLASGEVDRAEALWTAGTRRASVDAAAAWIEVARIRERHRGDLAGALEAAGAASRVLDLAFALGRGGGIRALGAVRLRVDSRLRRLRCWVAAAERRTARARRVA
ncbi:MAG TPA: ribonuclease H-like domain-containing protein [Candidatus Dormibacteraeota bacterium]|nr:ribonuclease H-like domain-containing protein [Candidatus Dormibacteraeota bacterium]